MLRPDLLRIKAMEEINVLNASETVREIIQELEQSQAFRVPTTRTEVR